MDRLISKKKLREAEVNSCYQNFKIFQKELTRSSYVKSQNFRPGLYGLKLTVK
jgi:hypothetical protein